MTRQSRKFDPEFQAFLKERVTVKDGVLKFTDVYAQMCVNFGWKGEMIVVPYSHVVWFATYGKWPTPGMHIDHINDDVTDNSPENLREVTEAENHRKRRGRKVYRSYGTGKYGFGINLHYDKRDGRYYVRRHMSRGHGSGDLKRINHGLGGFDTLAEAERCVQQTIIDIKENGLDYLPSARRKNPRRDAPKPEVIAEMQSLREAGHTFKEVADKLNISISTVYHHTRGLGNDRRIVRT